MFTVIFNAKAGQQDGKYAETVEIMRTLAFSQYYGDYLIDGHKKGQPCCPFFS